MSRLYLVATPIGNLEDLSFRAARILKETPLIAAEDTRTTKILLDHYQITTPLTAYHDHNKETKSKTLLEHLKGQDLALVSDAGTPAINDPGYYLVQAAIKEGHQVIPIPGPSAPVAALSASGLPTDNFLYLGYLPRKKGARLAVLDQIKDIHWTLVFLETPHRLVAALEDCLSVLGDREIAVSRELTKLHEEIKRGLISEVHTHFTENQPKGEITLVIAGRTNSLVWTEDQLHSEILRMSQSGQISPSKAAKTLALKSGWSRRDIYDLMQGLEKKEGNDQN